MYLEPITSLITTNPTTTTIQMEQTTDVQY